LFGAFTLHLISFSFFLIFFFKFIKVAEELELFQNGKVNSDGGRFKKAYEKAKKTKSAKLHDFVDIKVSACRRTC